MNFIKKYLAAVLILAALNSYGQDTLQLNKGIPQLNNYDIKKPKPVDSRYSALINGVGVPFRSVAEANAATNQAYRSQGLQKIIMVNGKQRLFTYQGGTADSNLLELVTKSDELINSTGILTRQATTLDDGTPINDAMVDSVMVFKDPTDGTYSLRSFSGKVDARWFKIDGNPATNVTVQLQNAINASIGVGLDLPEGTLLVNAPIILPDNFEMGGKGLKTTIKLADATNNLMIYKAAGSRVNIHDITFDGGIQTGIATNGFLFDGTTDVTITHCTFKNWKQGIWLNNGSGTPKNYDITYNDFYTCTDWVLRARDGVPNNVNFSNNHVRRVVTSGDLNIIVTAVIYSGINGKFNYNKIDTTFDTGIMLNGASCSDNQAIGNSIHSKLVGIYTGAGTRRSDIIGNNIMSDSDFAIHIQDVTQIKSGTIVSNNELHDCGKSAISMEGVDGVVVANNLIERVGLNGTQNNWQAGIVCTSTSIASCSNIVITGNKISSDNGVNNHMLYGVFLETMTNNVTITGNTVTDARYSNYQYVIPTGDWTINGRTSMSISADSASTTTRFTPKSYIGIGRYKMFVDSLGQLRYGLDSLPVLSINATLINHYDPSLNDVLTKNRASFLGANISRLTIPSLSADSAFAITSRTGQTSSILQLYGADGTAQYDFSQGGNLGLSGGIYLAGQIHASIYSGPNTRHLGATSTGDIVTMIDSTDIKIAAAIAGIPANNFSGVFDNPSNIPDVAGAVVTEQRRDSSFVAAGITKTPTTTVFQVLSSTTKPSIPWPAMTTTQRDAITSPAEGSVIYNLTTHAVNVWNNTAWKEIAFTP